MSLLYGAIPAKGSNAVSADIEYAPMRGGKTIYAGQFLKVLSSGSVATAAATDTGIYGIAAETKTTTSSEKTSKIGFYPADGKTYFLARTSGTGSQNSSRGTVCAIAVNTTNYYRIDPQTATAAVIKLIDFCDKGGDTRGGAKATAGQLVRFVIRPTRSTWLTLGR